MAEEPQDPPAPEPTPPKRRKRSRVRRFGVRTLALLTAIFAALLVTIFTVDVGPGLVGQAERRGSDWLARPMHIGKIKAKLWPGAFEFTDVVIEGLTSKDKPFLHAKKITVQLSWWTAFKRHLIIDAVEMSDWEMVVESFPGGRHNFPRVTGPPKKPGAGPRKFVTTLRQFVGSRGHVRYFDHSTPWSVDAPNMHITYFRRDLQADYGGTATFDKGTIRVQTYEPFAAKMTSRFSMNGPKVHFDRIDLLTDGAVSVLDGDIEMNRWPEQTYRIKSKIDIATQKHIFFNKDKFKATGTADFEGTFHYFKGGRELKGKWQTPVAHVTLGANTWQFPDLRGDVLWLPDRLEVTRAKSGLYGGTADFDYRILSLDQKSGPKRSIWEVSYRDVQLSQLTDFLETEGLRLSGSATGRNHLEWPVGKWALLRGEGEVRVEAPAGAVPMGRELRPEALARQATLPEEAGPFNPRLPLGYVPVAGHITYRLDPEWITLDKSWAATEKTYVEFEGRTAYMKDSRIPFHVTSLDWQESDRVFAGILTAFGSSTSAIPVGGYGEFDGVMLKTFAKPRIEGTFSGDRMRAWDVLWGRGTAKLAIENSYAYVTQSSLTRDGSEINATGTFSLGYPRKDGGEQLNANVRMVRRPMADLRHAFEMDDWPIEGFVSGEYHLYGNYETPFGVGTLAITEGVAYGETFEKATASLAFEGTGVRLNKFELQKGTGQVTGAVWVGWDGNYSFNADGRRIPVESLKLLEFPKAPLSGLLQFAASGTGSFEDPRYDVKMRIDDLFAGDEGIGFLTGNLGLRGELMTISFDAASPRLAVTGAGRVALNEEMDAEMTLRFSDTSLDPYVRFFEPRLSPFTQVVMDGTIRVTGELTNVDQLVVDANIERLDLKLFDYQVRNRKDKPIRIALERHIAKINQLELEGDGTALGVTGSVNLHESTIDVTAEGDANLGILQGFFRDIRSSGSANLKATVSGSLTKPEFRGSAGLRDGRLRYLYLPHGLEAINGTLSFDAGGIRVDDVKARIGRGDVVFGGRIGMDGFVPGELNLTATGERMNIRYIDGFPALIDADLGLRGTMQAPVLSGTVTVRDAEWTRRFEATPDILSLATGEKEAIGAPSAPAAVPLRLDIQVNAPGTLRIENNLARVRARADLRLGGTLDRPQLFGNAEILRGDLLFEGNRYVVTRGTVDFSNPLKIDPYVDIEAETRVRVPGSLGSTSQTYRVTIGITGTATQFTPTISSDPPLPNIDIISLLLGQTTDVDADLMRRNPATAAQSEAELLRGMASRLLVSPLSSPVGRVVEETLGFDTVQITPSIGTEADPLNPSARVIIGKRISSRAYLTFARALGGAGVRDQIITVEYDQSDRVGFVITQTGNNMFAIDFRVRHIF